VTQIGAKPQREIIVQPELPVEIRPIEDGEARRERVVTSMRLVWDSRIFVLKAAIVGLAVATLSAFLIPWQYESTTRLMPPDSRSSSGLSMLTALPAQAGAIGGIAGDLLGMKNSGALFVGVLRSRTVMDHIISRFDLNKVYGMKLQRDTRDGLMKKTMVDQDLKSGIITVSVNDRDPKRAAAIANAYVEELDRLITELSTSSARRERIFLEERLNAVKQDLESAEKDLSQFASKNGTIEITEQTKAMVGFAANLEGRLIAAQAELEGLKQIYTESNVRVRSTQARVTELKSQLQKLVGKSADAVPGGTDPSSESPAPSLRQLPIVAVPYADKFRRLKVEEVVFETLTKQYELAKVQEAKEIPTVKVLDPADVPEYKSFPPRWLIMKLGTMLAIIAAVVWIFAAARWREIDEKDPMKIFGYEVVGTVKAGLTRMSSNHLRQRAGAEDSPKQTDDQQRNMGGWSGKSL
jgi:capsule polysaccharide export protein KpsE/RkpR